jgi:CheY-like chemotaxis protein
VIELTFADEDVNVVAVSDGDEAIAVLERTPPDIVLADVGMSGRNGYEVAQHVKDTPKLAHIPVVLLTGAFEPIDQVKMAAAGCGGVISKPFEPHIVIGRVRELLARPRSTSKEEPSTASSTTAASRGTPTLAEPEGTAGSDGARGYFDRLEQELAGLSRRFAEEAKPVVSQPAPDPPAQFSSESLQQPPATGHPRGGPARPPLPPLSEAFAALLAAEQAAPSPISAPVWPAAALTGATTEVSDEFVETVVRRVLDRLSDRVVREAVSEHVSSVAERMIREEIDRIKSSID